MENNPGETERGSETPKVKPEQVRIRDATITVKRHVSIIFLTIGLAVSSILLPSHPVIANLVFLVTLADILYSIHLYIPRHIWRVRYKRRRLKVIYGAIMAIALITTSVHIYTNRSSISKPEPAQLLSQANTSDDGQASEPQPTNNNQSQSLKVAPESTPSTKAPLLSPLSNSNRNTERHKKDMPSASNKNSSSIINSPIINLPGSVQASGGTVYTQSDRRLIQSLKLDVTIDAQTPERPVTHGEYTWGEVSSSLFTKDKTRYRFLSGSIVYDQQVSPKIHRLALSFVPQFPDEILGKPIKSLASIDVFAINLVEIMKRRNFAQNDEPISFYLSVTVNGIQLGSMTANFTSKTLASGQANLTVSSLFAKLPEVYSKVVSRIQ